MKNVTVEAKLAWVFNDIHLAVISKSPIFPIFPRRLVLFSLIRNYL